jgi:ABC-type transport system substrate-binding protein
MMVMSGRKAPRLPAAALALVLVPFFLLPTATAPLPAMVARTSAQPALWNPIAPYADAVIFKVVTGSDVQVAALFSDDIDYIPVDIAGAYIEIDPPPYIKITKTDSFGYGCLAINCERYPFSIPGLRRALALAMDKAEIATIMWQSLGYPLDSPIPPSCGVWHNNATTPDYTSPDAAAAQAELAMAGFVDVDGDGWVEAPNGDDFVFRPIYSIAAPQWGAALNSQVPRWAAVGIDVQPQALDLNTLLDLVYTVPRDYDGAALRLELNPPGSSPLSLATWTSQQIAIPDGNFLNWANSTYDTIVTSMMTASDYDVVLEAAYAAQQVVVQEAPMIVLYGNYLLNAHRTDRFEGWVVSPGFGTGYQNLWIPRKVRLLQSQADRDPLTGCGGTFRSMIAADMDSQNPLVATSVYSRYILGQIYDSLTGLDDPRTEQPTKTGGGLAYDWTITELPTQLLLDFTLYGNATWQDGVPVTAEDVAFTYNYIKNHTAPAYNPVLSYLNCCIALDDYHVRITSNGKNYWAFEHLRNWIILPKHLWEGIVSPETFTNPEPIGSGPFRWYRHVAGEYVELRFWELYHKGFLHRPEYWPTSIPTPNWIVLGVCIIVLTLVASILYLRVPRRQPGPNH